MSGILYYVLEGSGRRTRKGGKLVEADEFSQMYRDLEGKPYGSPPSKRVSPEAKLSRWRRMRNYWGDLKTRRPRLTKGLKIGAAAGGTALAAGGLYKYYKRRKKRSEERND